MKASVLGLKGRRRQMYDFLLALAEASSSSMTSSSLELWDCWDISFLERRYQSPCQM
ncbi:hypothetical protein T11_9299 [Trichinella zimbabwensis]|uniref:Uncharacterized protein n=1 Tax=Trichinella zimbabwensis TaxID=268475 RepID=A0A0V1GFL3_9BILA|nr:hypothetical protein T11_9299 [Trichinella zimbabwensis]